jgi:Ran GTPase-activating protein (RanGAP) involved in mRNA processing and transport
MHMRFLQMGSLHNNDTLHTLIARQNHLGNSTALAIGTMLLQNRALKVLDIAWNIVGPPGGASVAHGLTYNSTLQVQLSPNCSAGFVHPCR